MSKRKPDKLSARDAALWQKVTDSITPLANRPVPPLTARSVRGTAHETAHETALNYPHGGTSDRALPAAWYQGAEGSSAQTPDTDIERRTKRRIVRGQTPVDQVLDLHGLNQQQAYRRLKRQIEMAVLHGNRCVLVITGKGGKRFLQTGVSAAHRKREDFDTLGGVLKAQVPLWLAEPDIAPFVQSYAPAAPSHGGEGALYVLLRRRERIGGKRS